MDVHGPIRLFPEETSQQKEIKKLSKSNTRLIVGTAVAVAFAAIAVTALVLDLAYGGKQIGQWVQNTFDSAKKLGSTSYDKAANFAQTAYHQAADAAQNAYKQASSFAHSAYDKATGLGREGLDKASELGREGLKQASNIYNKAVTWINGNTHVPNWVWATMAGAGLVTAGGVVISIAVKRKIERNQEAKALAASELRSDQELDALVKDLGIEIEQMKQEVQSQEDHNYVVASDSEAEVSSEEGSDNEDVTEDNAHYVSIKTLNEIGNELEKSNKARNNNTQASSSVVVDFSNLQRGEGLKKDFLKGTMLGDFIASAKTGFGWNAKKNQKKS